MQLKIFLAMLALATSSLDTIAQKVKRKGVTPATIPKKQPAATYSIGQLSGKWQEMKRSATDRKTAVNFSDTLLMSFTGSTVELKDATSMRMTMKGVAEIEAPNALIVAGDTYSIRSLYKDVLVIDDGEFIREFRKKEQFYYETVGKIKVERDSFVIVRSVLMKDLMGKWIVYRRQAVPGFLKPATAILKSFSVNSMNTDGSAVGEVVFYTADISQALSCRFIMEEGNLQIVTDKPFWKLSTYKATKDEFVFGDVAGLLYYSKRY
ncbi:hypothetical protein BH11BAC4_BH11BAC4_12350 [soil metagenome]